MYVEKVKNNGIDYLRLVESVYTPGTKGCRKRVLLNIGPLSKYDDGLPDYVNRLKESFKNGVPLIPSLLDYCKDNNPVKKHTLTFVDYTEDCVGAPKIFGSALIEQILWEIGVIPVINSYKGFKKLEYDIAGFVRLLIYGRILSPASKIATTKQNDNYYEKVIDDDFYEYNVYDSLDFIYEHKKQLINRINNKLTTAGKRDSSIIFYDVTNFFFETHNPDEDILDIEGNVIEKGIRKNKVCKDNKKQPIVQMGLFCDFNGYPISIEIFPGNTLDHLTVQQSLINNIDNLINSRYIFIGDRGITNYVNICHLVSRGKGYIVGKSIRKSNAEERKWVLMKDDYITNRDSSFKYKSMIVRKTVKDEDGKDVTLDIKLVAYFSKKYYDKQMNENKSFLDFLKKLEENPHSFRITSTQSNFLKPFLKKELVNYKTGETINSGVLRSYIDYDKVNEYKELFGYFLLATSELAMPEKEIIDKYHLSPSIEHIYRMFKTDLSARPLYVRNKEHIEAHLLICMISVIVLKLIQNKIVDKYGKKEDSLWELGLTGERISAALNKWSVDKLPGEKYRFNNLDDPDLMKILNAFDIKVPKVLYQKQELKSLKKSIKIL